MKLLYFYTKHNTQCRVLEDDGKIPAYAEKIDCEENPDMAHGYGVVSVPRFIIVEDDYSLGRVRSGVNATDCVNTDAVDKWFKEACA